MTIKVTKALEADGRWLFIVPIQGLQISKEVNQEIRVIRVTFITRDKLPSVRKKLGFPDKISVLLKNRILSKFFESKSTYAICTLSGSGKNLESKFLNLVKQELEYLSLSQLGYSRRRHNACLALANTKPVGKVSYLLLNTNTRSISNQNKLVGHYNDLIINERWKKYHKQGYYFNFLNILQSNKLKKNWLNDIKNAARLIGQSQSSNSLSHAFLWNMIALETLLLSSGDTHSQELPKRVEAFIGWAINWEVEDFSQKIQNTYKKRCALVHDGNIEDLTIEDLLFTDNLLLNVLHNVINNIRMFPNKSELIKFSKKIEAEHILGLKSKTRPKTLRFLKIIYSESDYEKTHYFI